MSDFTLDYSGPRGLSIARFKDRNGEQCSIQHSSIATEDCLWLGVNQTVPKVLVHNVGWQDVPLPADALTSSRMHLTRPMVRALLPLLQNFADHGTMWGDAE